MNTQFSIEEYPLQEETYKIIGVAMEIHRVPGKGFSEIVYKDALEGRSIKLYQWPMFL